MPRRKPAAPKKMAPVKSERNSQEAEASSSPSLKRLKVAKEVSVKRRCSPGFVYTVGQGDVGQLGLGPDVMELARPALVAELKDVVDVVAGGMHTLCLTADGKVWSFGCNDEGALGRQTSSLEGTETTPGIVELPEPVAQLTAGDSHSAALTVSGKVYLWGNFRDSRGQMGLVTEGKAEQAPKLVVSDIVQIASGSDHVVMLTVKGNMLTMGCGEQGQLGRVPIRTTLRRACCPSLDMLKPINVYIPKPSGCKTRAFDRIWAGPYNTYARLRETGKLYGCGLNNYHQMGVQAHTSTDSGHIISVPRPLTSCQGHRWELVSGGQHHTLLLSEEGSVFTLGRKDYGRLGLGASMPAGNEDQETPAQVPGLSGCVEVSCGEAVSFAIDGEGCLHSWGFGTNGQLGHGGDDDLFEPKIVAGKLTGKKVLVISGGGQHAVILAT
ncbi:regulator of chromosome condensation-like [Dermacentor silvarum]|uniref:regulator of chromosome condensation-like n=1 Tax=Dermacentor silvarum TaxID=543639 RepID=UPI002100EEF2|nr:regulator of chromosome condensation-like [Dermacentor silvarum]